MNWLEDPCDLRGQYRDWIQEKVDNEMVEYKADAVKRLYILTKSDLSEELAATIAFGYQEGLPEARNIVLRLDLCDKHIAALNDDSRYMTDILHDEMNQTVEEPY